MLKNVIVKGDVLKSLLNTFSSSEEFVEFSTMFLGTTLDYLATFHQLQDLDAKDCRGNEEYTQLTAKSVFLIALFCRANIDIIHELVKKVDFEQVEQNG